VGDRVECVGPTRVLIGVCGGTVGGDSP